MEKTLQISVFETFQMAPQKPNLPSFDSIKKNYHTMINIESVNALEDLSRAFAGRAPCGYNLNIINIRVALA